MSSEVFDVTSVTYGAKGDTIRLLDGAMTSGSSTLTSASASFAATDVGKTIYVTGAGTSGATLETTIATFVSSTNVTLSVAASTNVSGVIFIYGTDDSTAIWSANNAAGTVGGTVYFPTGNYLLTITINVTAPCTYEGLGISNTVITRGAAVTGPLFWIQANNCAFKNMTIDGGYPCNQVNVQSELYIATNKNIVDGIEIVNFYNNGISILGSYNTVQNSIFTGQSSATVSSTFGIWFDTTGVVGTIISGNSFTGMRLNAIFGRGNLTQICDNYFGGNHCQTSPTGGGQIAFNTSNLATRCLIANNTIGQGGGSVTSGLEINGVDFVIADNVIEYQGLYGIVLEGGSNFVVSNNLVKNSGWVGGIYVYSGITDFQIIGNRCYDDQATKTQQWGVYVNAGSSDRYIIKDNHLIGNINAAGLSDSGTGANKIVKDNLPLLPVATKNWVCETQVGGTAISSFGIAAPTTSGSATNKQDSQGDWVQYTSSTTNGSIAGWTSAFTATQLTYMPVFTAVVELPNATDFGSGNNSRVWAGLTSASITGSDTLNNVSGLAFRCAAGKSDTQWMVCYNNGTATAPAAVASGVTVAANTRYLLQINAINNTSVNFLINGVVVATVTSNLPSSTQDMGLVVTNTTTTNGAKHICISSVTGSEVA